MTAEKGIPGAISGAVRPRCGRWLLIALGTVVLYYAGLLGTASTYAVRLATRPLLAWQRRTR